jgi:hypothetical protein
MSLFIIFSFLLLTAHAAIPLTSLRSSKKAIASTLAPTCGTMLCNGRRMHCCPETPTANVPSKPHPACEPIYINNATCIYCCGGKPVPEIAPESSKPQPACEPIYINNATCIYCCGGKPVPEIASETSIPHPTCVSISIMGVCVYCCAQEHNEE